MGTVALIAFVEDGVEVGRIVRHQDGYFAGEGLNLCETLTKCPFMPLKEAADAHFDDLIFEDRHADRYAPGQECSFASYDYIVLRNSGGEYGPGDEYPTIVAINRFGVAVVADPFDFRDKIK